MKNIRQIVYCHGLCVCLGTDHANMIMKLACILKGDYCLIVRCRLEKVSLIRSHLGHRSKGSTVQTLNIKLFVVRGYLSHMKCNPLGDVSCSFLRVISRFETLFFD